MVLAASSQSGPQPFSAFGRGPTHTIHPDIVRTADLQVRFVVATSAAAGARSGPARRAVQLIRWRDYESQSPGEHAREFAKPVADKPPTNADNRGIFPVIANGARGG